MEGVRVLLVFVFVSLAAVGCEARKQFDIINLRLNWTAALDYCKERHTDLATIRSQEENDLILQLWKNTLPVRKGSSLWIGATVLFSSKGYYWMVDGVTVEGYQNWLSGQPDNAFGTERCLTYHSYAGSGAIGWNDLTCSNEVPFACEYFAN